MKCTIILLLAACLQVSANGHAQTISVKLRDIPFEKALKEISQKSGYGLFYLQEQIKEAKPVTISKENVDVKDVLNELFKEQPLKYEITNKTIVVSPKEAKKGVKEVKEGMSVEEVAPLPPPTIDVSGRVTDEDGNPLMGASVMIKGTKIGTQTNAEGYFTLKGVEEKAVLEISYVGFEKRELTPAAVRITRNIALKRSESPLDVVQIEAYTKNTRRFQVGNSHSVKSADLEKQPVNNPMLALQGRVPGLFVTQTTGVNGGAINIRIQGQNSITKGNEPLIIVDGVPFFEELPIVLGQNQLANAGGNPLNYINVDDIESVDILKDADATAIYGSRAANGAIIITTKKGKAGGIRVRINAQRGWGEVTRKAKMMNTRQYLDMRYEAYRNDGIDWTNPAISANDLKFWDTTRYTDWQKELIGGDASYTKLNLSVSGGNQLVQYVLGSSYNKTTDVFPGSFANKNAGLHFSITSSSSNQKFRMELTGSYLLSDNQLPGTDLTEDAVRLEPLAPALYSGDTLNWAVNASGTETWQNPLRYTLYRDFTNTTRNLVANLTLSYKLLSGFILKTNMGYTNLYAYSHRPQPLMWLPPSQRANTLRTSNFDQTNLTNYIFEPQLNYGTNVDKGRFELLAGSTIQSNSSMSFSTQASGYPSDLLLGSTTGATSITSNVSNPKYKYIGLFGRLNFNWDRKYILSMNVRRDGSSRFGENSRFSNFWSAGLGWIFSEETLLRSIPLLSFGKIRVTYGTSGNDQIGDYSYIATYGSLNNPSSIFFQSSPTLGILGLHNPYLQWELTRKLQVGMDVGFLKDRFILSLTYARNSSSNQLIQYKLPSITGYTTVVQNFPATVQNTSLEGIVEAKIIKSKFLQWNSSINFTIPRNKLVSFPGIENTSYANGTSGVIVGQPLGVKSTFGFGGVSPLNGAYAGLDRFGKPVIPLNPLDRVQIVSMQPIYYGGIQNSVKYKGFQLDFLFQFVRRIGDISAFYYNGSTIPGRFITGLSNQPANLLEAGRWQSPGDNANIGRFTTAGNFLIGGGTAAQNSAMYSTNSSFIRLKNLALSWSIPTKLLTRLKIQSASLYMNAQNLLTITRYPGLDPETGWSLPPLRMWTIGFKSEF